MGYRKIVNLYKDSRIIKVFKEVYALEKIHGTSAHVSYNDGKLNFFPGGIKLTDFMKCMDEDAIFEAFKKLGHDHVTVFGEAYGGKCQAMSKVYGPDIRFIAFEVKIYDYLQNMWLDVETAERVATKLGFEFVPWVLGPASIEFVNEQRDAPSEVAKLRGMGDNHTREGVVLRPIIETYHNGDRFIAKHKHPDFRETKTPRVVDPKKQLLLSDAKRVAEEYVVSMRIEHVVDKYIAEQLQEKQDFLLSMEHCGDIIRRTIQDIKDEEGTDIKWTKETNKAIGSATARIFKRNVLEGKYIKG